MPIRIALLLGAAMDITDFITPTIAVLGLGLSVINTYTNFKRDQVRIKMEFGDWFFDGRIPHLGKNMCNHKWKVYIGLINTGNVDVFVSSVGFTCRGGNKVPWTNDFTEDFGDKLPCRLSPKKKADFLLDLDKMRTTHGAIVTGFFASTECGQELTGGREYLAKFLGARAEI